MKEENSKLNSILRSLKAEEVGVLKEKSRVEEIANTRKSTLDELEQAQGQLQSEIDQCLGKKKNSAVLSGDSQKVAGLNNYAIRLKEKFDEYTPKIKKASMDYEKALTRLQNYEKLLVEKRLEKKKIEKLMENQMSKDRIKREALVELDNDERSTYKNRK